MYTRLNTQEDKESVPVAKIHPEDREARIAEREEKKRHLLAEIQHLNYLNRSDGVLGCCGASLGESLYDDPVLNKVSHRWWTSVNGKILGRASIETNAIIRNCLSFLLAMRLNAWADFTINQSVQVNAYSHMQVLAFVFLFTIIFILSSTSMDTWVQKQMGGDANLINSEHILDVNQSLKMRAMMTTL